MVDGDVTLFVVFTDTYDNKVSYHYAYINDDSFDSKYGIPDIGTIVVSELVTSPDQVFNRVEFMKTLGEVNIMMTDCGFWDIEPN